jgi:hypothetical protein
MLDPEANQKRESAAMSGFARFGGLDQLDWLMILASVLLGTVAKQHHVRSTRLVSGMGVPVPGDGVRLQSAPEDYRSGRKTPRSGQRHPRRIERHRCVRCFLLSTTERMC